MQWYLTSDLSFKTATRDELKQRMLMILKSELRPQVSPAHDPRTKHKAYREEIILSLLSPTVTQNEQFSTVSPNYPSVATILTIHWVESYKKLHFTGKMSYKYSLNLSLIWLHCIVAKAYPHEHWTNMAYEDNQICGSNLE